MKCDIIDLVEFRCPYCGSLLLRHEIILGKIEIKCHNSKCKKLVAEKFNQLRSS